MAIYLSNLLLKLQLVLSFFLMKIDEVIPESSSGKGNLMSFIHGWNCLPHDQHKKMQIKPRGLEYSWFFRWLIYCLYFRNGMIFRPLFLLLTLARRSPTGSIGALRRITVFLATIWDVFGNQDNQFPICLAVAKQRTPLVVETLHVPACTTRQSTKIPQWSKFENDLGDAGDISRILVFTACYCGTLHLRQGIAQAPVAAFAPPPALGHWEVSDLWGWAT